MHSSHSADQRHSLDRMPWSEEGYAGRRPIKLEKKDLGQWPARLTVAAALYHSPSRLPPSPAHHFDPGRKREDTRRRSAPGQVGCSREKSKGKPANQLASSTATCPSESPISSEAWWPESASLSVRVRPLPLHSPAARAPCMHGAGGHRTDLARPAQAQRLVADTAGPGHRRKDKAKALRFPLSLFTTLSGIAGARNISRREQAIRPSSSGGGWAGAARAASSSAGGEWSRRSVEWSTTAASRPRASPATEHGEPRRRCGLRAERGLAGHAIEEEWPLASHLLIRERTGPSADFGFLCVESDRHSRAGA